MSERATLPAGFKWCGCSPDPLPLSSFGKNRCRPDGKQDTCRDCCNERSAAQRARKKAAEASARPRKQRPAPLNVGALLTATTVQWGLDGTDLGTQLGFAAVMVRLVRDGEYPEFRQMYETAGGEGER